MKKLSIFMPNDEINLGKINNKNISIDSINDFSAQNNYKLNKNE